MTTAAIQKPQSSAANLAAVIAGRRDAFAQVAPKHFHVDRLVKLAQASLSRTPKLAQCTPESVLVQLMRCAELGIEPNSPLGGMHLVPYENRKTNKTECQGIIDYRALVALARRSDQISAIAARAVYTNDLFDPYEDEKGIHFTFKQATGDRGELKEVFAYATLKSGEVQFDRMSKAEVEKIRSRSRAGQSGPWVTDFEEMAKKTVLRRLSKLLPLTTEAAAVVAEEEAIEGEVAVEALPTPASAGTAAAIKSKLAAKLGKPAEPPPAQPEQAEEPLGELPAEEELEDRGADQ